MLEIYTRPELAPGDNKAISVDMAFISDFKLTMFDDTCAETISEIDGAKLIDRAMGTVVTPMGTTSISNLSSGCKAVLLVYLSSVGKLDYTCINVTECGVNARNGSQRFQSLWSC